jgi:hypothetical protein
VPFADLRSLHPELVAILSHELAHALISQATAERAPKWVQEGLAQHVEMTQEVTNPFPDLGAAGSSLSLDVVEKALGGFSEEQFVELSYAEAAWAFHYLEARHGVAGIRRLLAAYKGGADNAAAVKQALGLGPADLDTAVRRWAEHDAPLAWPSKVRRYDNEAAKLALMAEKEAPPTRVAGISPRFEDPRVARARVMGAWHAEYLAWAQPLKVAYTPVQAAIADNSWTAKDAAACGRLADATAGVIDRRELFDAPDPRVNEPLHDALVALHQLGRACSSGDVSTSRNLATRANSLLTQVARVFAEYGLQL